MVKLPINPKPHGREREADKPPRFNRLLLQPYSAMEIYVYCGIRPGGILKDEHLRHVLKNRLQSARKLFGPERTDKVLRTVGYQDCDEYVASWWLHFTDPGGPRTEYLAFEYSEVSDVRDRMIYEEFKLDLAAQAARSKGGPEIIPG